MKKFKNYFIMMHYAILIINFLFQSENLLGQITLDTAFQTWNDIGYDFYPVQISQNETKYYFQDTLTNTFSLYNLDFTPFLQNIAVPEPYDPFGKNMEVIYISRTLFDCDSSNIEYGYTSIGTGYNPFYIMRTDGSQIFKLDSALAPWSVGTLNGSEDVRPIINTASGAKLFLYYPKNTNFLHIYSLCGTLPPGFYSHTHEIFQQSFIKVIPNPTSGLVTFQIDLPDNVNDYELLIFDNNQREAKREKIKPGNNKYIIDLSGKSDGFYYYSISSKDKCYHLGKFILIK